MLKQLSDVLRNVKARDDETDLNTRIAPVVRILNGALDEDPSSPNAIVLNGRIDPQTLRFLKVDESYQRPLAERPEIFMALKEGIVVPNIDIGVRGQDFITEGDDFLIRSPAFIIDGYQRVGNAIRLLDMIPDHPLRIFATVHFGTNDLWERHRFTELNKNVKRVSPNLHLRNMRDGNEAILTLYGLSHNQRDFPLCGRVAWSQNMLRGEVVTALQFAKAATYLHAHHAGLTSQAAESVARALLIVASKIGLQNFRRNVCTFFEIVDEAWGIRSVEYASSAAQLKSGFLSVLARIFSSHIDFWDTSDRIFFVTADMRRKLAKFPLNDPHIRNLAGAGGAGKNILADLLVKHINSGRRTGHIRSRYEKDA